MNKTFTLSVLEKLRSKLLDLTGRNNLISYKHSLRSQKQIRIVDEALSELLSKFSEEENYFKFKSIPLPEVEYPEENSEEFKSKFEDLKLIDSEYLIEIEGVGEDPSEKAILKIENALRDKVRKELNLPIVSRKITTTIEDQAVRFEINPNYELSTSSENISHSDEFIQTLLYPEDLKRKLKSIYEFNNLNESETGVSTLFCALGFLEWYESESSEKKILSPLVLVPIRLERELVKGEHEYKVLQREEVLNNDSLIEKCRNDFGISLPTFNEGDKLDEYYLKCSELINKNKNWKIRNFGTIGFFSFSKFLMYKDLKEENLQGIDLEESLVAKIINGSQSNAGITFGIDYEIDTDEVIRSKIPDLITDADSSQVSAILDVLDGKNLVIEGPPGTGKSQTITNIIASCLANGKKVLFLAEKNAALLVVKNRLDKAGFGDFCFELHSNKIQKNLIYKNLEKSIKQRAENSSNNFQATKEKIHQIKQELKNYIHALSNVNLLFNVSYQKLMWKKINIENSFPIEMIRKLQKFEWSTTVDEYNSNLDFLERFQVRFKDHKLNEISNGDWSFLDFNKVTPFSMEECYEDLCKLSNVLNGINLPGTKNNLPLEQAVHILKIVNGFDSNKTSHRIATFISNSEDVFMSFDQYINSMKEKNDTVIKIKALYNGNYDVQKIDLAGSYSNVKSKYATEKIKNLNDLKESIEIDVEAVASHYKEIAGVSKFASDSSEDLESVKMILDNILILKKSSVSIFRHLLEKEELQKCKDLNRLRVNLEESKSQVSYSFTPEIYKVDLNTIYNWKMILTKSGFFSFLNPEYRNVKKQISNCFKSSFDKRKVLNCLNVLQEYYVKLEEFENNKTNIFFKGKGLDLANKSVIEELISLHEAAKDSYQLSIGIFGEDNYPLFELDKHQVSILIQKVSSVIGVLLKYNTASFKSFNILASKIILELDSLINSTANDIQSLGHLEVHELFKLEDLLSLYNSLKNVVETVLHVYPIFKEVEVDKCETTYNLIEKLKAINGLELKCLSFDHLLNGEDINESISKIEIYLSLEERFIKHWVSSDIYFKKISNKELNETLLSLLKRNQLLRGTIDYNVFKASTVNTNVFDFITKYNSLELDVENISISFEYVNILNECNYFFRINPLLMINVGDDLNHLRRKFSDLDSELMKNYQYKLKSDLNKRIITEGVSTGRVSEKTELGFIKHQFTLKMRHAPIRLLLKKSSRALQDIMPCFMMSPLTLAQYIPIGSLEFDVLIMDEASQLRPEDSIGALFRAKQVIIVGDPKQLPPTSFFDASSNGQVDEEDESGVSASDIDYESILDMGIKSFSPARRLKWHYRSKHQDLISFSNKNFYDGDLVIFPAPSQDHELFGLELIAVENGIYENRRNVKEAEALLDWMQAFIVKYPEKSIGIVTMNQPQQELISDLFEKRLKEDPILEAYTKDKESTLEKVIIKNLENIQGDERDIILISTVYGKELNAPQVKQRFGPINSKMGHRRLNVLFTRARYKNVVFSSLDSADIVPTTSSSFGVQIFKEYLSFAKNKILIENDRTSGEPDSDFEIFVIKELKKNGFEVTCQVGVSGYKIDIGVLDPNNKGRYLCGVECDGATYHSAKSVRDRDKIRQEILESLGWNIYRIWSTDWFSNKEHEMKKLITYLDKIKRDN